MTAAAVLEQGCDDKAQLYGRGNAGATERQAVSVDPAALELFPRLEAALRGVGMVVRRVDLADGVSLQTARRGDIVLRRATKSSLSFGRRKVVIDASEEDSDMAAHFAAALAQPDGGVAVDPSSRELVRRAELAAPHDVGVLIVGPSGTGKEVVAKLVHQLSRRRGDFVAVNCAALPDAMFEALLFGHRQGAFTGATQNSAGLFCAAQGGTLFLDEIGEVSLANQAKLLRAIQEREILPLGARRPIKVDARVVAATNRDLPALVREGDFRADLFYRLNVFPLATRPLAERPGDLMMLIAMLLLHHCERGKRCPFPTAAALDKLRTHAWPGNARELSNVVQRALILSNDAIEPLHVIFDEELATPDLARPPRALKPLDRLMRDHELAMIDAALVACGGRRAAAAKRLGISERTLRYKLAAVGVDDRADALTLQ